ncbi:MAG: tRNA lysidine(34) synthetase TilS [Planctomycetia bacterium]|nr:tRNA lysidine(34) synthetase TilS [Planctomycetia bacterium]
MSASRTATEASLDRHRLVESLAGMLDEFPASRRILAAVSGGADSMALLRGLLELRETGRVELYVGHLDHQLRALSSADATWLEAVCENHHVPCTIGRVDVAGAARESGRGIEEAARDARYAFLEATARSKDCPVIALAHTADDQAETILHHILRGTGLAGLRGIPRERELAGGIRLVRPLLEIDRSTVLDYLGQLGQDFREDETNGDESYTRNRIRRQLLPLLAREFNPQIGEALRRLAQQAADSQAALDELADAWLDRILESSAGECRVKWQPLTELPRHLVREVFAALWRRQGWPRQRMGFAQWDELAEVALAGGTITSPSRIEARREGRWVALRPK